MGVVWICLDCGKIISKKTQTNKHADITGHRRFKCYIS